MRFIFDFEKLTRHNRSIRCFKKSVRLREKDRAYLFNKVDILKMLTTSPVVYENPTKSIN